MKRKEITKLRSKSLLELAKEEEKLRTEISHMTLESKMSPPKDTNKLRKAKERLAVVLTITSENKLAKKRSETEL